MPQPRAKKARTYTSRAAPAYQYDVEEIYQRSLQPGNFKYLRHLEENGVMESFLWPLFFLQHDQHQHQQSKNIHKHKPSKKNSDKFQLPKAASLLMQLTNIRTSSNAIAKGSMNGPLSFMVNANVGDNDDTADNDIDNDNAAAAGAFRLFLTTLLSDTGTGTSTGTGDKDSDSDMVGIVSFLTTVYNNMTREMYPLYEVHYWTWSVLVCGMIQILLVAVRIMTRTRMRMVGYAYS